MNDQVKELYERMYSPQEIPRKVTMLFERANFLLNRIDAPAMTVRDLAIIAGVAEFLDPTTELPDEAMMPPEFREVIDTSEPDPEPAEPETQQGPTGPTGPMDAPTTPSPDHRALSQAKMNKMTRAELAVHAKEFYGWTVPEDAKRHQIMKGIKTKTAIK